MPLSPNALRKARARFSVFNWLNAQSFTLLSGNIITVFAMGFTESKTTIGVITMFGFTTFFFLLLGRRLARGRPLVRVFGVAWLLRYLSMLPVLAIPPLVAFGAGEWAAPVLALSVFLFNFFRGIGMIGNNPVLAHLSEGPDRGRFMTTIGLISNVAAIGTLVAVTFALKAVSGDAAATRLVYMILIAVGVASGVVGSLLLLKTPEPVEYKPATHAPLLATVREAFRDRHYRVFMASFAILSFVAGNGRSFLAVYAKTVYRHNDDAVMAYTVAMFLGSVLMGLLTRKLVDRFGSKPLYVIYGAIALASFVPAIVMPTLGSFPAEAAFLAALNFVVAFGYSGADGAGQTWYFNFIKPEKTFDLSVVYFMALGLGGSLGSMAGGWSLDLLSWAGLSPELSFRIFFAFNAAATALALALVMRLPSQGGKAVGETLGIMFNLRDLRTLGLLERLDRTLTPGDEIRLLKRVGESESPVVETDLLPYLDSPRFDVRTEALLSLEQLPHIGHDAAARLVEDIETNPFTTAYISARIAGKKARGEGRRHAVAALRKAIRSADYMLVASAAVALARLGDAESLQAVEDLAVSTDNPRVQIACAFALELYDASESVPVLLGLTRSAGRPGYVVDEILLSVASILGELDEFYPLYSTFRVDEGRAYIALYDMADECGPERAGELREAIDAWRCDSSPNSTLLARLFTKRDELLGRTGLSYVFQDAILDPTCASYSGFRFFASATAVIDAGRKGKAGRGGTVRA